MGRNDRENMEHTVWKLRKEEFFFHLLNESRIDILFLTLLSINYRRNEGYSIIAKIFVIEEGTFLDSLLKYPISFVTRRKKKEKKKGKEN